MMTKTGTASRRKAGLREDWPDAPDRDCEALDALACDLHDRAPDGFVVARFNNGRGVPGVNVSRINSGYWDLLVSIVEDPADPDILVILVSGRHIAPARRGIDLRDPSSLDRLDQILADAGIPLADET